MIQFIDGAIAFIQHYREATLFVCGLWLLVAFFLVLTLGHSIKRVREEAHAHDWEAHVIDQDRIDEHHVRVHVMHKCKECGAQKDYTRVEERWAH